MRLLYLSLFTLVSAHNWVNTASRAPFAGRQWPCMPKYTAAPHIQVNAGQKFQVEWSTGHDGYTYFALLSTSDYHNLMDVTDAVFQDYISSAPVTNRVPCTKFRRTNNVEYFGTPMSSFFQSEVNIAETDYLFRPIDGWLADTPGWVHQWRFTPGDLVPDEAVAYSSTTYPWLKAVWRFAIRVAWQMDVDVAEFVVPTGSPTGEYILFYKWAGYSDCIDIHVTSAAVSSTYGFAPPPGQAPQRVSRIDHCFHPNPDVSLGLPRMVFPTAGGADACLSECTFRGCTGVNIWPLKLPDRPLFTATMPSWNPSNNLWTAHWNWAWSNLSNTYIPAAWRNSTILDLIRSKLQAINNWDVLVCTLFNVTASPGQDKYIVTDDPSHPAWYSTCFEFEPAVSFLGFDTTNDVFNRDYDWKYYGQCISCQDAATNSQAIKNLVVEWKPASTCEFCELENPTAQPVTPFLSAVRIGSTPSTFTTNTNCGVNTSFPNHCEKVLLPVGYCSSTTIADPSPCSSGPFNTYQTLQTANMCADYARRDPDCGDWMIYRQDTQRCSCYRAPVGPYACCDRLPASVNSLVPNIYQLVNRGPDPNCSTGFPATVGKGCCSPGCSACDSNNATRGGGFCCDYLIPPTRLCTQVGPPCWLP